MTRDEQRTEYHKVIGLLTEAAERLEKMHKEPIPTSSTSWTHDYDAARYAYQIRQMLSTDGGEAGMIALLHTLYERYY